YNFNLKLRAVGRKTPFDAVLKWYDEKPDIFIINPNHLNVGLNTLLSYLVIYNHHIPQRAINHQTPMQAVQKWQEDKPELFVKKVYDQAGLDK
ncbi:MAG: hypothetical protein PHE96_13660, partial [Methylococcales bacterium]|nr:hypothetical protein [Methylococcales bacterium]